MDRHGEASATGTGKARHDLVAALPKFAGLSIWLVALVMALTELSFNIEPLLARLGVAGLARGPGRADAD